MHKVHSSEQIGLEELRELVGLELNLLLSLDVLPAAFNGVKCDFGDEAVFEMAGQRALYHRVSLRREGEGAIGTALFAQEPIIGALLLSVGLGDYCDLTELPPEERSGFRLISYGYPRVVVQSRARGGQLFFLLRNQGVTLSPVSDDMTALAPLESVLAASEIKARAERFWSRINLWRCLRARVGIKETQFLVLERERFCLTFRDVLKVVSPVVGIDARRGADLGSGLQSQNNTRWCVPASAQMIFDFYGYQYEQYEVASLLKQGPEIQPLELDLPLQHNVVSALEKGSRESLQVRMNAFPIWEEIVKEINHGRPLVGLLVGHAQVIVGYYLSMVSSESGDFYIRGLRVLDPWPPGRGRVVVWENFDSHWYQIMFSAVINKLSERELNIEEIVRDHGAYFLKSALISDAIVRERGYVVGTYKLLDRPQWFVGVVVESRMRGFMLLDAGLGFQGYYSVWETDFAHEGTGLDWLDPSSAKAEARWLAGADEILSEPKVVLNEASALVGWGVNARRQGGHKYMLEVKRRRFERH